MVQDVTRSGDPFSNGVELLTILRDRLLVFEWQITEDSIDLGGGITALGATDNNHFCWIKIEIIDLVGKKHLSLQGDLDGTGDLSPRLLLLFDEGKINKVWIVGDRDSGGIAIKNYFTYSGAIAYGFLERFNPEDPFAWMVSYANNKLGDAYVAKSHLGTQWHKIADSYYNADVLAATSSNGSHQGIWDLTTAIPWGSFTTLSIINAGYYAQGGSPNGTNNLSCITRRWYVEGDEQPEQYSGADSFKCRGFVKHFYNGFGSDYGGAIWSDGSNNVYLVVGSSGWQGMRLSVSQPPSLAVDLPIVNDEYDLSRFPAAIIDRILNVLSALGWQKIQNTIADSGDRSLILQGQYFDLKEYCYLNLKWYSDTSTIELRGEVREKPGIVTATSAPLTFSNITRLRIKANAQAGVVFLNDTEIYFGFYGGRIDKTDKYAWGIGIVGSDLNKQFVARSYYSKRYWQAIGSGFEQSTQKRSSYPVNGFGDRLSVPLIPFDYFGNEDPRNSAQAFQGSGKPDFFAVIEGRGNKLDYGALTFGEQKPKPLYYRGYVQFADNKY